MNTSPSEQHVVFSLDQQEFALRLAAVERIVRAVEVTPLPRMPEIGLGIINVRGQITPVFDLRKRFGLPAREIEPDDQFIIARARTRRVALVVDDVRGLDESLAEGAIPARVILPNIEHVSGVAKLGDRFIFIHDLDKFLSFDEERELDGALELARPYGRFHSK